MFETSKPKHYQLVSSAVGPWGKSTVYAGITDEHPVDDGAAEEDTKALSVSSVTSTHKDAKEKIGSYVSHHSNLRMMKPGRSHSSVVSRHSRSKDFVMKAYEEPPKMVVDQLPYFQASMFATVLEDAITEMRILVECNTQLRISKTLADLGLLKAIKYGVKQPDFKDELDGIDPNNLNCIEYKLNKLDADRKYLANVLLDTYKDLSLNHTFNVLVGYVHSVVTLNEYRAWLHEDVTRNKMIRKDKTRELRQQRIHIKTVTNNNDVTIDGLNSQLEDASLDAEIRCRYVDNWENSRTEQHVGTIGDKENVYISSIDYFKQRSENEQRVHAEVELLVNICINETLEKIEEWMAKYEKDLEAIDLKIFIKKNEYQTMLEEREYLEDTFKKHSALIKNWLDFKEEREKQRQFELLMNNSARTVQAWWRGLLVRKGMGPYRVKKKKGGKEAAAGGKKK